MKLALLTPLCLLAPASALTGTETLYTIERPANAPGGWASTIEYLPDLTGDGVGELALAPRVHGGGVTYVFNGADGSHLYDINQAHHVLFFGRGIEGVSDQTGDGIPEIVIVGFRSGDASSPDGRIHVHSGADGSLVRAVTPPPGVSLREGRILALGDADGDGFEDILIRAFGADVPRLQLFSTVTGEALYSGVLDPAQASLLTNPERLDDYDGDGFDDYAVGWITAIQGTRHIQIRSGLTGAVLNELSNPSFTPTGNGEPLVRMADRDGDGRDDFALGAVFEGLVGVYSSADGSTLREWTCPEPVCLGSAIINIGDLNGDGLEDLIAAEGDPPGTFGTGLVGLDVATGTTIFSEDVNGINGGYLTMDPLVPTPGVDPLFPTFALFEFNEDHVVLKRFVPFDDGFTFPGFCTAENTSLGTPASITANGSRSLAADNVVLGCIDLPTNAFGYFLMSRNQTFIPTPPGSQGNLCVGPPLVRFAGNVLNSGVAGTVAFTPDSSALPNNTTWLAGETWNFQYWTRDGQNPSNFSDLASIVWCD